MVKKLLGAVCAVLFTASLALAGAWEDTCYIFGVHPSQVEKPKVTRVYQSPEEVGCYGVYWPNLNAIILYHDDPRILVHEYAHAVMNSDAFQEQWARWAEQKLHGEVFNGTD